MRSKLEITAEDRLHGNYRIVLTLLTRLCMETSVFRVLSHDRDRHRMLLGLIKGSPLTHAIDGVGTITL